MKYPKSKKMRVLAFTEQGKRIKSFKSIHAFRKFANLPHLCNHTLKELKSGNIIYVKGYILGLTNIYQGHNNINPLESKYLLGKFNRVKRNNFKKLIQLNSEKQEIIMIDNTLKILGCFNGTIEQLAKREKVPVGTIKSSLSKTPTRFINRNNLLKAKFYIHLKDLPVFINHIRKLL